jgi:ATP-dependent RNA helicase SUPV3L1/SUV3
MQAAPERRVTAVLGPTNTGKTYLAVDRMLGHATGMIGFPLRLLARENYDRIVRLKGARAVALVTGEEKILPPNPRYFVCTVESMPLDRRVAFLAIDEVQLAADPERGHVFTDRVLHARGEEETMLLGSETIRPLLRRLVPGARYSSRPRFSRLTYAGTKKLARLPRRSAVVAFSAADVYRIAELIRRQRGGTAVVMGALSPRTRNAQVAMYQAGEVDYLVATDAIGMGLNMDVDHVAFAGLVKFDGHSPRPLAAAEVAQIAGRAGRHMNDGTFGATADLSDIPAEIVEAVENHRFDTVAAVRWRNSELSFRTVTDLIASLEVLPPARDLLRTRDADDHLALATLIRDPEILRLARGPAAVRLLWEVCGIPDFRKVLTEAHTRLLSQIYRLLVRGEGLLPEAWVGRHIARLDDEQGDIDALTQRIAHVRTWTYISHRGDWLADPDEWRERARAIEDKLSDALHDRLTQRFVDRRRAVIARRLAEGGDLLAAVTAEGEVLVEGQPMGRLEGFLFVPDRAAAGPEARPLRAAARRVVVTAAQERLRRFEREPDEAFSIAADGRVCWRDRPVARLRPGAALLAPRVEPLPADLLDGRSREIVRARLDRWLAAHLAAGLRPLFRLIEADLAGAARGLAYRLAEQLGSARRAEVADQVAALSRADRMRLSQLGLRFGAEAVWVAGALSPRAVRLRSLLWTVDAGRAPPVLPAAGRKRMERDPALPASFYAAAGYCVAGSVVLRIDVFERIAAMARSLGRQGPFAATARLVNEAGGAEALAAALAELGHGANTGTDGIAWFRRAERRGKPRGGSRRSRRAAPESPFAMLRELMGGE